MFIWFIRSIFFLLVFSFMLLGFKEGGPFYYTDIEGLGFYQVMTVTGGLLVIIVGLAIDLLVPRKSLTALAGVSFGLVVGLLVGMAFAYVIDLIFETYNITETNNSNLHTAKGGIKWLVNLLCCYWAVTFIMQTKDDFRFIIPYVEFSKQFKGNTPLLLDTSVIIDGRIADIAATKIFSSPMLIPRFILNELQNIADSPDRLKRNRGRRGLDILNKMQNNEEIDLSIREIELSAQEKLEPVDLQLVSAAKHLEGKIITNDFNLNKVSRLRGVDVVNINDLAGALKAIILPGELLCLKIVKQGDQAGQGIGYLDDGTMVVVEQGRQSVGQTVNITITSALQTSAGRMIFGKLENAEHDNYNR